MPNANPYQIHTKAVIVWVSREYSQGNITRAQARKEISLLKKREWQANEMKDWEDKHLGQGGAKCFLKWEDRVNSRYNTEEAIAEAKREYGAPKVIMGSRKREDIWRENLRTRFQKTGGQYNPGKAIRVMNAIVKEAPPHSLTKENLAFITGMSESWAQSTLTGAVTHGKMKRISTTYYEPV